MKLYSFSTLLLAERFFAQNQTIQLPSPGPKNLLRAANTDHPVLADFPNAVIIEPSPWGFSAGKSRYGQANCVWYSTGGSQYAQYCSNTQFNVPSCEYRGPNASANKPTDAGTWNGWNCGVDDTVCFASVPGTTNWWTAKDLCQSMFGANMAAPRNAAEHMVIVPIIPNDGINGFGYVWQGMFLDYENSIAYYVNGVGPTESVDWVLDESMASTTFEEEDYSNDYYQEDALTILEEIILNGGFYVGRKKRDTAEDFADMSMLISRNGCWCPSTLVAGEHFHGAPLNSYDTACRKLSQCKHKAQTCASGSCFTENLDAGFQYAFDDVSKGYACRSTNACDTAMCMCIVEFGKEVLELAVDDGAMIIDDGDLDLIAGNDQCVVNVDSVGNAGGIC